MLRRYRYAGRNLDQAEWARSIGEGKHMTSTMKHRTARLKLNAIAGLAGLGGIAMMPLPAAAQGTPEQQAACQDDAMRLCGQFVPDVQRITTCMIQMRRYLSPRCRATLESARRRRAGY
jgi:hypothetical protein